MELALICVVGVLLALAIIGVALRLAALARLVRDLALCVGRIAAQIEGGGHGRDD